MNPLFNRPPVFCLTLGLLALILLVQPTVASPINAPQVPNVAIVEDGWTLIRTVSAANPMAAHYNPLDGLLYYARRPGSGGSLNRINADGTLTQIVTADRPAAAVIDPTDGDIFLAEDYGGNIYRSAFGSTTRSTWVSGFHSGDDDPVGMAIAPAGYTGPIVSPGQALVIDRGNAGSDEIWRWSPATAEGEVQIYTDPDGGGALVDPVDIAISDSSIYFVDAKGAADGAIYRLDAGPVLTLIATNTPIADPVGIVVDPLNGDLLVLDAATDKVLRVHLSAGEAIGDVSEMMTGFTGLLWAGIDISSDGASLFITDYSGNQVYTFHRGNVFTFDKIALPPQWTVAPLQPGGIPTGSMIQRYLLRYYYGSILVNPPPLTVSISDTLPATLTFQSEIHYPAMSFGQAGQTLTWQTQQPVARGEAGQIEISTRDDNPQSGDVLTNTAALHAGPYDLSALTVTQAPIVAPLLVSPGSGEMCAGDYEIHGQVQPNMTVHLLLDGNPALQVQADATGLFSATQTYSGAAQVALSAQACTAGGQCSPVSPAITLEPPLSFWCPQHSTWQGTPTAGPLAGQHLTFYFRDNSGQYSTQGWRMPGVYGFWNTTLHLRGCNCPAASGTTAPPTSVWMIADGVRYDPTGAYPDFIFAVTGGAHTVVFWAQCGANLVSSSGRILIDPDGYVFDVTQGFDPITPTLHAVAGVTVTAYVSNTAWGGWVPWPAHLYNDQVNPQVTGADGYFAFFTPPGFYYLQVDGKAGYQPWRSPVIQVVDEIVHVNVPYTPLPQTPLSAVLLAAAGPQPQTVTLTVGSAVQWLAEVDGLAPPEVLMQQNENPSLHPLSALNPISNTLGWDGGMMAPGRIYERQMSAAGLFTYTDGLGHTGQVCVSYVEDVNRDGVVDLLDLQAVASAWGTVNPTLDMDQDGDVDIVDVILVTRRWGWSCQA